MAGIINGQPVDAPNSNAAWLAKNGDDSTVGKLGLLNTEPASGPSITQANGVQRLLNALTSFLGMSLTAVYNALPTWTNNDVGTGTDDVRDRADALTEKFNTSTGHAHDGSTGAGAPISAPDLIDVPLVGRVVQAADLPTVSGSSYNVTGTLTGSTPSSSQTTEGVVVNAPYNKVILRQASGSDTDDVFRDALGNIVYGRLTYSAGVWTLSFYVDLAGVETAYTFSSPVALRWYYQKLFSPFNPLFPVYSEFAVIPSDNATADVVDATASQRGLVSTGAQSFGGVKTFADTTQSTSKDTGAVVLEGGLGVEKNAYVGGNVVATGTVTGSNLSGTNTGDVTLTAVGSSPNGNGASLSGQALTLQPADATNPGLLTAIAQVIGGAKTFVAGVIHQVFFATEREDVASAASINPLSSSKSYVKLTGTTATTVHGATAGVNGQRLVFQNATNQTATLKHESGTATAANRFILPGGTDLTVTAGASVELIYDTGQSRWVPASGSGSGSGGGALVVTGSRGTPQNITAAGGIAFVGASGSRQMWFVQGNGGHIDVTVNPQIAAGTSVGQELLVAGCNDDQTLTLDDGTGLKLNGQIILGAYSLLGLVWDGTDWCETFRR